MADADPKFHKASEEKIVVEPVAAPVEETLVVARARRSWLRPLLMFGLPLIVLSIAGYFWFTGGRTVSTDNAYVSQDKVSVSSDVAGRIVNVAVKENQAVKKGDLLFEIDPEPYRIAVASARAQIAATMERLDTAWLRDLDLRLLAEGEQAGAA